jgi:hypothetical protein
MRRSSFWRAREANRRNRVMNFLERMATGARPSDLDGDSRTTATSSCRRRPVSTTFLCASRSPERADSASVPTIQSGHVQKSPREQDSNAPPRVHIQQVAVAGYDDTSTNCCGQFEVLVVLCVATVRDAEFRLHPQPAASEISAKIAARSTGARQRLELRPCQDTKDFGLHRWRKSDDVLLPGLQDCLSRYSVALQRGSNDGAGINDDQFRRSAL